VTDQAAAIAGRFLAARRNASALADYPGPLPETPDASYAIQDAAIAAWGKPVIGWKVGRILPPLSDRFGADRFAGPIFASAIAAGPGDRPTMSIFAEGGAAVEAEFLLRIGTAPAAGQTRLTLEETAELIDRVHVGIEIASSPLRVLNALGPVAVISDFGNNNGLVIGPEIEEWRTSGFEAWTVTTSVDGVEMGSGQATAFPDGAIGAARFLFELMARRGIALRRGQWISSGAVSGVHDVKPGQTADVRFGDRHEVGCSVTAARPE
jgi:2-keto-4-pentenoate hydratase